MDDSPDAKGPSKKLTQWFFGVTSHETLGKSEGFGVWDFFPSGYLPSTNGRQVKNSMKYDLKKRKKNIVSLNYPIK